jgi:hypothetical protein
MRDIISIVKGWIDNKSQLLYKGRAHANVFFERLVK